MKCDFQGWASKNNLRCADGRIIRNGAFDDNDGKRVPLVFGHQHDSIDNVLGHAILEKRPEGVWAYGFFNNTPNASKAKEAVDHGDITALSIWANQLQQVGSDVMHGVIKEVSLVLAGANPGAFIESTLSHGEPMDDGDYEGIFYTNDNLYLEHALDEDDEDGKEDENDDDSDDKTVADVLKTMNEEQLAAVGQLMDQVVDETLEASKAKDNDEDDSDEETNNKEDNEMKHNLFENQSAGNAKISEADYKQFFATAKRMGSLREAIHNEIENDGVLAHALDTTGMTTPSEAEGRKTYGVQGVDMLFPDYKNVTREPIMISRNMEWVGKVMNGIHHVPFSRIKSLFADITEDEARAKGYIKGNMKKEEVFSLLKRTTDPQTIYKKQKLDKDDIDDITDFDVVMWIRREMRMMLDEEIARAILIGDGRTSMAEDKIKEQHVRPIVSDVALFNVQTAVEVASGATFEQKAEALEDSILRARKKYKGSGNPTFFTTEDVITDMLLRKDKNGRRIYETVAALADALRVKEIIAVEPMEGQTVTIGMDEDLPLLGVIVNLTDYNVGADKGGKIDTFDDFDIDYNQYKYLIETRMSGALVKPFAALTFGLKVQA